MNNMPIQPTPVAFEVVHSTNADVLSQTVNDMLQAGWTLSGQLTQFNGELCIALVKIELQPVKLGSMLESNVLPVQGLIQR
jgi:hypothetical protein